MWKVRLRRQQQTNKNKTTKSPTKSPTKSTAKQQQSSSNKSPKKIKQQTNSKSSTKTGKKQQQSYSSAKSPSRSPNRRTASNDSNIKVKAGEKRKSPTNSSKAVPKAKKSKPVAIKPKSGSTSKASSSKDNETIHTTPIKAVKAPEGVQISEQDALKVSESLRIPNRKDSNGKIDTPAVTVEASKTETIITVDEALEDTVVILDNIKSPENLKVSDIEEFIEADVVEEQSAINTKETCVEELKAIGLEGLTPVEETTVAMETMTDDNEHLTLTNLEVVPVHVSDLHALTSATVPQDKNVPIKRNRVLLKKMKKEPVEDQFIARSVGCQAAFKNVCAYCGRNFKMAYLLTLHLRTHSGVREYKCKQCDKSYYSSSSLKTHMKVHTSQDKFECDVCLRQFIYKNSLKMHLATHSEDRPFSCHVCGKTFKQNVSLQGHLQQHKGVMYGCEVCGQKFTERSSVYRHMKLHTGVKPYHCEVCGKAFVRKGNLKEHASTHEPTSLQTVYNCSACGKKYRHRPSIHKHLQVCEAQKSRQTIVIEGTSSERNTDTVSPVKLTHDVGC